MQETKTFEGAPPGIARDRWWLEATPGAQAGGDGAQGEVAAGRGQRLLGLLALVGLADVLF